MATAEELQASLESFAQSCNENERLQSMIKDWNRVLHIHATDLKQDHTLITDGGSVTAKLGIPATRKMAIKMPSAN